MKTLSSVFSDNLNKILKNNQWSQVDLARRANMAPQLLSKYLLCQIEPSLSQLERFSEAVGIPASELISTGDLKRVRTAKHSISECLAAVTKHVHKKRS